MQIGLNEHEVVTRRRTFAPQAVSLVRYVLIFHFFSGMEKISADWIKRTQSGYPKAYFCTSSGEFSPICADFYHSYLMVPPPRTISPSYTTTACPFAIALCGESNSICTVSFPVTVMVAGSSF